MIRNRWMYISFVCGALALTPRAADAAKKSGVEMSDTVNVAGQILKLNGLGTREATIFAIDVYVAGLYVPTPSKDPKVLMTSNVPKKLVLQFVRDVDADDITGAFTDSFKRNKFGDNIKAQLKRLNGWMTDMKDGQSMSFTYVPDKGLTVEVNGKVKGVVAGRDFHSSFLAIWLGANPPNSGLKRGLLGK